MEPVPINASFNLYNSRLQSPPYTGSRVLVVLHAQQCLLLSHRLIRCPTTHPLQVSYLEIYNDQLYDLLSETPGTSEHLSVTEDSNGNTFVSDRLGVCPARTSSADTDMHAVAMQIRL